MPNDPRLKFKKKVYDASRNIIYFQGSGGGGRLRSIYEDGTPTDEGGGDTGGGGTGGGGEGGGGVVPYTPRDIPVIPQPIKPTLDPGAISGITIGSVAAAAALTEAARRTLNAPRQQGFTEISQKDLSSRQSGSNRRTTSKRAAARGASGAISRAIETTGQAFEMMTPTRAAGYSQVPIQAEMVPPSGAVTPVADLQRATTRPLRDVGTDRLTSVFPSETGTIGRPPAPTSAPVPAIPRRPNVPLNLEEKLISLKSELVNPSISEARSKTIQSEIRIIERELALEIGITKPHGIFEIANDPDSVSEFFVTMYYYDANLEANVYLFQSEQVGVGEIKYIPYKLPNDFAVTEFTLYVDSDGNVLTSYVLPKSPGHENGIVNDSQDENRVLFGMLRNYHQYIIIFLTIGYPPS